MGRAAFTYLSNKFKFIKILKMYVKFQGFKNSLENVWENVPI